MQIFECGMGIELRGLSEGSQGRFDVREKDLKTNCRADLWWSALIGATFLFYFGVLLYSECGLANRSWENLEKKRVVQGFVLIVAILLISTRPFDKRARVGALLLAVAGTMPAFPHADMRGVWRDLPGFFGALLWVPQLAHFMALPFFFTFHALLPRSRLKFQHWILVWLPAVFLVGWALTGLFRRVYHPDWEAHDPPRWYLFVVGVSVLVYGFGGLGAMVWNFFQVPSASERRQLAVLTFGMTAGWFPVLLFLAAIFLAPFTESHLVWALVVAPFKHIALAMFALVPISLAYALLRDRALDVQ